MADIRINALPTTASASSSDDYIALDGTTNGTRKLNAYSPTFGGNLTVSGTGSFAGDVAVTKASGNASSQVYATSTTGIAQADIKSGNGTTSSRISRIVLRTDETSPQRWDVGLIATKDWAVQNNTLSGTNALSIDAATNATTLAGNLTVSGGTIGTAASTNLTLNGGSSGASLVLGQGTTGDATFSNSANTGFIVGANNATSGTGAFSAIGLLAGTRQSFIYRFSEGYSSSGYYVAGALVFENNGTAGHMIFADAGSESMRITATTRNVLIGTTTDGGQKLQVAGTAYVSGRLTTNTGTVVTGGESIATGSGQPIGVQLRYGSVADTAELLAFDWANNGAKNLTLRGTALTLQTGTYGSTTALTLDSSQNATFSGGTVTLGDYAGDQDVIIAAQSTGVGYLRWRPTASGTNAYGFSIAYDNPNTKLSFLRHEFSTAGTEWLSVARSTGNATFAGSIAINNTVQTAVSVASTHKVTISIGGVTYYLLATNV